MSPKPARAGAPALRRPVSDLRALAHPLRLRMMELFSEQPRTTNQVAEILRQPPTRLYHHVAALERAGLLVLKETRQNRGAVEKWYAGVAREYRVTGTTRRKSSSSRAARRALAATVLDQAKQELLSAPNDSEAPLLGRLVIPASKVAIPKIRQRLYETIKKLAAEFQPEDPDSAGDGCERWAITFALTPTAVDRRSR